MNGSGRLKGNGVELVRERAIAGKIQAALERLYRLERVADVADFVSETPEGERETLLVRQTGDGALEVSLQLPLLAREADLDTLCQIIEGVSHFVYVVERARAGRETTQLELELQAEVDKWVVLAASMRTFDVVTSADLRARLYEDVTFAHGPSSERGERYRIANDAANRFVRFLETRYVGRAQYSDLHTVLRRFFHVGQEEKLRFGRVA